MSIFLLISFIIYQASVAVLKTIRLPLGSIQWPRHQWPLSLKWFNFNLSIINNHMPNKVWDEITYPIQNFNGKLYRLHRWSLGMDRQFHPTHYIIDVISYQNWVKLIHITKSGHSEGWSSCIGISYFGHSAGKLSSLRPGEAILWQRTGSTLSQSMACFLKTSMHYPTSFRDNS